MKPSVAHTFAAQAVGLDPVAIAAEDDAHLLELLSAIAMRRGFGEMMLSVHRAQKQLALDRRRDWRGLDGWIV